LVKTQYFLMSFEVLVLHGLNSLFASLWPCVLQ
jgi:hypothetical protein